MGDLGQPTTEEHLQAAREQLKEVQRGGSNPTAAARLAFGDFLLWWKSRKPLMPRPDYGGQSA